MKKKYSNKQLFLLNEKLRQNFIEKEEFFLPTRVNFFLFKNINSISSLCDEIEQAKMKIAQKFGTLQEDGNYKVPQDKIPTAQAELDVLFAIDQAVEIYTISLEELKDVQLTTKQMDALFFMIEE